MMWVISVKTLLLRMLGVNGCTCHLLVTASWLLNLPTFAHKPVNNSVVFNFAHDVVMFANGDWLECFAQAVGLAGRSCATGKSRKGQENNQLVCISSRGDVYVAANNARSPTPTVAVGACCFSRPTRIYYDFK